MAIKKISKNMIISTNNKELIIAKKELKEITNSKLLEATNENLALNTPKKIISNGNRK